MRNQLFQIAPTKFFVCHLSWIFTGLIAAVCILFVPSHDTCFLINFIHYSIAALRPWTPSPLILTPSKLHLWCNLLSFLCLRSLSICTVHGQILKPWEQQDQTWDPKFECSLPELCDAPAMHATSPFDVHLLSSSLLPLLFMLAAAMVSSNIPIPTLQYHLMKLHSTTPKRCLSTSRKFWSVSVPLLPPLVSPINILILCAR